MASRFPTNDPDVGGTSAPSPGPSKPKPAAPGFPNKMPASNLFLTPQQVANFRPMFPQSSLGSILAKMPGLGPAPAPAPLFNFGNLGGGGFAAQPAPPSIGSLLALLSGGY